MGLLLEKYFFFVFDIVFVNLIGKNLLNKWNCYIKYIIEELFLEVVENFFIYDEIIIDMGDNIFILCLWFKNIYSVNYSFRNFVDRRFFIF